MKKENKASQWIPANIPFTSISLDKYNLRIAWMDDPSISQSTLIKLFWENYDIREIIKSIETLGFFRHEVPVVVKDTEEEGRYIVIEGNRRLAALKIIHNPDFEFIQPSNRKWLHDILQKIKAEIEIIPVYVAPSRDACLPVMVLKHASEDHSSWKTLMQAYLYWNYMKDNPQTTIETAATHFNITSSKFNEYVRLYNLFQLIKGMENLPQEVKQAARNAITIPITTFERILKSKKVAEYLKIPNNWYLEDEKDIAFFNTAMCNIIIDVITKTENSRSLDTVADIEKFFFSYNKAKPNVSPCTKSNDENKTEQGSSGARDDPYSSSRPSPSGKRPATTRETKSIMRTHIAFGLKNASALKKIYTELYDLNVDTKPNASVALFRVFLDKATRKFLERNGIKKCPIVNKNGDRISERPFTKADFSECLHFISSSQSDLVTDSIKKSLQFFLGVGDSGMEQSKNKISGMNQLIHNHEINYTPEEAKNLWPQFESYVKIILTE